MRGRFKFGRPRTGAKGVGRFACGRLASRLALESISDVSGVLERVNAEFDWNDFEPGRDLSQVTTSVTRAQLVDDLPTGTKLHLSGLTDTWTDRDLAQLQAELDNLMNLDEIGGYVHRNGGYEPDPGFKVQIRAPDFPKYEGTVGDLVKDAAWGVLRGCVTDRGQPRYELKILDSNDHVRLDPDDRVFPDLSGVTFTIRMMVYQGGRFRGSGYSLAEARALGRARGGVRIYLDGFQNILVWITGRRLVGSRSGSSQAANYPQRSASRRAGQRSRPSSAPTTREYAVVRCCIACPRPEPGDYG